MSEEPLYGDRLVEIHRDAILFRHYFFPTGDRRVPLAEILRVEALRPTTGTGRWRVHGTSDGRTWFPRDWKRATRDTVFVAHLKDSADRIGFTVEDSARARRVLQDLGLLAPPGAVPAAP